MALKELDFRALEDWKSVELFEREARVLESIEHPNVPEYLDTFTVEEDGTLRLFLVQEYVSGMNLVASLRERGRWTKEQALEALEAVTEATWEGGVVRPSLTSPKVSDNGLSQLSSAQLAQAKAEFDAELESLQTEQGIWDDLTTLYILGRQPENRGL